MEYSIKMTSSQPYDIRLTYMSTPAKDTFTFFDSKDMIRVMLSKLPVESVWNEIIEDYKAKGLDRMIEEVNTGAPESGGEWTPPDQPKLSFSSFIGHL